MKRFDPDETFARIVKYYVDKMHYPLDRANAIAKVITQEQQEKWRENER